MHVPEDGHMSGRNMQEMHYVDNILSRTYVHLLVLAVRLKKIKTSIFFFAKYITFHFTDL